MKKNPTMKVKTMSKPSIHQKEAQKEKCKFDVLGYCKVCGGHALKNLSEKNCRGKQTKKEEMIKPFNLDELFQKKEKEFQKFPCSLPMAIYNLKKYRKSEYP